MYNAARPIAGAVFLLDGSSSIALGFILICLSCSAVINLCSSLQMIIGFDIAGPELNYLPSMYKDSFLKVII